MTQQWHGQLEQDRWCADHFRHKHGGTFLDIGCGDPTDISNTWALERYLGWRGLAIDNDPELIAKYTCRPNTIAICCDALTADFNRIFHDFGMPLSIDFVSLDLEPPNLALIVLENLLKSSVHFAALTFEHDLYRAGRYRQQRAYELLKAKGYKRAITTDQDDFYVR